MKCSNCNSEIKEGDLFCGVCGTKVNNNINNDMYNNTNNINNNIIQDTENLLDVYIGNNSDKIRKGGFSFCTLFFGVFYTIYRKMWLFSLIWYLFNVVLIYLLKGYANIAIFFISIIISIKFKDIYINFASKNINKIKSENQFKSQNEIRELCRKKGGVSVGILIIFIVLYFALQIIIVWNVFDSFNKNENVDNNLTEYNNINKLKVNIPSGFEPSKYNDEDFQNFRYNDDKTYDYCSFNYSISKYNRDNASDYLKRTVYTSLDDKVSEIEKKNINGNEWVFINVVNDYANTYYYAIIYDGITYKLEYKMSSEPCNYCIKAKDNIINSIKFK